MMILVVIVRQYMKYKIAPELELQTIELVSLAGQPIDISTEFAGKNILLTAFATWCGPCHAEVAGMEAARPTLEQAGFVLIHISDEEVGKIQGFINKNPSGITYLRTTVLLEKIGVHTYPTHFLFDKNGALRYKQTDPFDWSDPQVITGLIKQVDWINYAQM